MKLLYRLKKYKQVNKSEYCEIIYCGRNHSGQNQSFQIFSDHLNTTYLKLNHLFI